MIAKNFFPQIKKFVDLEKYRGFFEEKINLMYSNLFVAFNFVSLEKLKDVFWKIYKKPNEYNPLDWYYLCAICIIRAYAPDILLKEGRIHEETYRIIGDWLNYITSRVLPSEKVLPDNFFKILYSDAPIPVPDIKSMKTLLEDNMDLITNHNIPADLGNSNIPAIKRIKIFQENFLSYFELFKRKCQFIEKHLARSENRKCLYKLYDIFQINNNNERTPPKYVEGALIVLIHVRNACAHKTFTLINNNTVLIRDYKPHSNEITYEDRRTIVQLWEFYYVLLALDRTFGVLALMIMLLRHLTYINNQFGKFVYCQRCNSLNHYIIHPNQNIIICKNCKYPHLVKDLKFITGF